MKEILHEKQIEERHESNLCNLSLKNFIKPQANHK